MTIPEHGCASQSLPDMRTHVLRETSKPRDSQMASHPFCGHCETADEAVLVGIVSVHMFYLGPYKIRKTSQKRILMFASETEAKKPASPKPPVRKPPLNASAVRHLWYSEVRAVKSHNQPLTSAISSRYSCSIVIRRPSSNRPGRV